MKLTIVSHTRHYYDHNGTLKGWGPTVREINYLASKFDEITHLGCIHPGEPPASALPYEATNIRFVALPPSGGAGWRKKLAVFTVAPEIIRKLNQELPFTDALQLRVPTGMANYLLPYLTFRKNKPLVWVKYAGNWGQPNAPLGYRFQRWWLRNNFLKCTVTINGSWPGQPKHCITFENPCLDNEERKDGLQTIKNKNYSGPYTACFIGRIETPKGVRRILDALPRIAAKKINKIHFIGDGEERRAFESEVKNRTDISLLFHGSVSRMEISAYLRQSHFLLLPSTASEGFPKVIAEGANYGAIPIVSDVSGITQYVNSENGFIWNSNTPFPDWVDKLVFDPGNLVLKSAEAYKMAEAFTFENYYRKLAREILP